MMQATLMIFPWCINLVLWSDQKKVNDKAEITDSEAEAAHCLDVCHTNSGIVVFSRSFLVVGLTCTSANRCERFSSERTVV